jgi:hypothetical protein
LEPCQPPRPIGFETARNQIGGVLLKMKPQFLVEFLFLPLAAPQTMPPLHCLPPLVTMGIKANRLK